MGIVRLPDFICQPSIATGELISLLSDFEPPQLGIYLIHLEERRLNRRMHLFAEAMETACRQAQEQHAE